jgi:type VI secretion system secreted protein VgrG
MDRLATIRQQEQDTTRVAFTGVSSVRHFIPGHTFDMKCVPATAPGKTFDGSYVLTSVRHQASQTLADSDQGSDASYENEFDCLSDTVKIRPGRVTPCPTIVGVQTAVVVGPAGEEIFVDEYGRVKVQFHWDRLGKRDENSSCWVRVSQGWAGEKWGMVTIPRIGQEVIVSFIEGNPDRPIITGRVYNGEQMPPYELPANKTQSGIKSRSSKGGSPANFNEIRFEDKKGEEEVYIHAEKNETIIVENDKSESVGHDESISIGNDRTEQVGHDETMSVGNNRSRTVGAN